MMPTRTNLKQIMFCVIFLVVVLGCSSSYAESISATAQSLPACDPKCGCDGMYSYDEVKGECVLNLQKLMKKVMVRYDNQNDDDIMAKDSMERSIYIEGQKLFRGIMISVILFMTCAAICVLSACIYCCRINYSDRKLKRKVKALARKMNKDYNPKKASTKSTIDEPKSQSCNVVIEEAGVYVV